MPALDTPIYCRSCGYDVRANDGRCSECGREFDRGDPRTFLSRPRRKWARWLRRAGYVLLAVSLLLGAAWGSLYRGWKREQNALAKLRPRHVRAEAIGPPWLRHWLGRVGMVLDRTQALDFWYKPITDADLVQLKGLSRLQLLALGNTHITDAGLPHLKDMRRLEGLGVSGTAVSDAGLVHLKGLSGLRRLGLGDTRVTDAGVAELQKALPNCRILR